MVLKTLASVVLALVGMAIAILPLVLQRPFGTQTAAGMWLAHTARQWGTLVTIACAIAVAAAAWSVSRGPRSWAKALLVVPVGLALAAVWVARQNPFEWWFNGLDEPRFVSAGAASFVEPTDLVLAVAREGESAAYPVRLVAYHHIVNDRIGRTPAVVTY